MRPHFEQLGAFFAQTFHTFRLSKDKTKRDNFMKTGLSLLIKVILMTSFLQNVFGFNSPHNHRKRVRNNIVYGPSLYAEDIHTIFNYRKNLWANLSSENVNSIVLLSLLLDNMGVFNNPQYAQDVALTANQINHLKVIQQQRNLKVIVEGGVTLSNFCNIRNNDNYLALRAATQEMLMYRRLTSRGVKIHEINLDGPFLRLLSMSRKEHGCQLEGLGFPIERATVIVAHYMRHLKRLIEAEQNNHPVKINLLINLPNWRIDDYMEISWGTHKNQPIDLRTVLNHFNRVLDSSSIYPGVNEVVLDYPYNFANGHRHRKLVQSNTNNPSLCGSGVNCVSTSPESAFLSKVTKLMGIMNVMKGYPELSFLINDQVANPLHSCIKENITGSQLRPFNSNRCLNTAHPQRQEALNYQAAKDREFIQKSQLYYNLILNKLPPTIRLGSAYFESWIPTPKNSERYGNEIRRILRQEGH